MAASWNPAFRPNSVESPVANPVEISQQSPKAPEQLSSEPSFEVVDKENASSDHADGWFTQEDDEGGAGNWLDDAPPREPEIAAPPPNELIEVAKVDVPAPEEDTSQPESFAEEEPSANAAKHASTMSFARTVSHEVSWDDGDVEDAQWNLEAIDTPDPFQFMPPSDRTNSFPPVPQQPAPMSAEEHALPSTQAQDLMEEAENGSEAASDHGDAVFGEGVHGTEEEALAARFEEGVPLIPHSEDGLDVPAEVKPLHVGDVFAEEADDFFSQVQDSEAPASLGIDRKSTMQAMDVANTPHVSRQDTLEDLPETTDEGASGLFGTVDTKAPATDDRHQAEPAPENEEALAAKWSQTFADDMDDDFLLDDSAENKDLASGMDPSGFSFEIDDDGFLDDVDETQPTTSPATVPAAVAPQASTTTPTSSRYAPRTAAPPLNQQPSNPYFPQAPSYQGQPVVPTQASYGYGTSFAQATSAPYGVPQPQHQTPAGPKAQSFVDKAKGGYHSPYDLPMEVVKPRKRQSLGPKATPVSQPGVVPPPRISSIATHGPPPSGGARPPSRDSLPSPSDQKPSQPLKHKETFFEDLPIMAKPRPSSRHGTPQFAPPNLPPTSSGPPAPSLYSQVPAAAQPSMARSTSGGTPSPYAPAPAAVPQMNRAGLSGTYAPMPSAAPPQMTRSGSGSSYAPPPMGRSGSSGSYAPPPMARSGSGGTPNPVAAEKTTPYASMPMATPQGAPSGSVDIPNLVQPERVHPYAPISEQTHTVPPAPSHTSSAPPPQTSARYSPAQAPAAPASTVSLPNGAPPTASARYSPAPPPAPGSRPSSGYGHGPPLILPHQPRTSSPLAHFESHSAPNGNIVHNDRRSSSHYEHKMSRVAALPPTREVEEENEAASTHPAPSQFTNTQPPPPSDSRYSPMPPATRQTPPPPQAQSAFSPPKRSPYAPQLASQTVHQAPPLSHTQSPGSNHGAINGIRREPRGRSDSVPSPTSPTSTKIMASSQVPTHRRRAPSMNLNLVAPTDGREHDSLQRWKGSPIITWGMGGTMVTTFPKDVPRYGVGQTAPMIHRAPGEVKVTHVKDLQPLEERLAKFPGPLKGKSKKKETIAWLTAGIDELEKQAPNMTYMSTPSLDEKRAVERLLLWKILRVFIENDGAVEGNAAVVKAVRDILAPDLEEATSQEPAFGVSAIGDALQAGATKVQADSVDPVTMEQLRKHLMIGDREKAAWEAADKRLWGHALLIANTVSPDLYKQVAEDFVRKEVNFPGHNNESLAALYKVLSGNFEDCVDELVPSHARAGLQLVATTSSTPQTKDALEGLDKWRETLCLVLSNRSPNDAQALLSLGDLLSGYGRAEAAHICFIFSRQVAVFGGLDDPQSNFVLVGSDHRRHGDQFFKETEALMLSEVYEYGLSLAGGNTNSAAHLAAYKLNLAMTLAEYGYRDKALQYCDGILNSIGAQTKRSPYHHAVLEQNVDDFIKRLKQAPKEESSSWISKPSMNKVSDTMWNRFNKFVAGDENDAEGKGASNHVSADSSPFARIGGGTPSISRSPSVTNFDAYGNSPVGYGQPPMPLPGAAPVPQPTTRPASRYAPMAAHPTSNVSPYEPSTGYTPAPRASMERTSSELQRSLMEPTQTAGQPSQYASSPAGMSYPSQTPTYGMGTEVPYSGQPGPEQSSYHPTAPAPATSGYAPRPTHESPSAPTSSFVHNAQPRGNPYDPSSEPREEPATPHNQGYQPSFGYEPPSIGSIEGPSALEPATQESGEQASSRGYDPPSYQPYGYEPSSYEPPAYEPDNEADEDNEKPKPKKKTIFDDDDHDIPAPTMSQEKSKEEKDRENAEMFRKIAEEEGKLMSPASFKLARR